MNAEQLLAQRGLRKFIFFLGNMEHEKCLSVISQCDLFVRPALADGDANCVREALALGIPVVASTAGYRPAEAVLFESGNVNDLVLKIDETLSRPLAVAPCGPTASEWGAGLRLDGAGESGGGLRLDGAGAGIQRLIDIYASLQEEGSDGNTQPLTPHARS